MSSLPQISRRELLKALKKNGYILDRQRGSHMILRQQIAPFRRVVVPDHKEVAEGTLRGILRQTGLTVDELKKLLWE